MIKTNVCFDFTDFLGGVEQLHRRHVADHDGSEWPLRPRPVRGGVGRHFFDDGLGRQRRFGHCRIRLSVGEHGRQQVRVGVAGCVVFTLSTAL